MTSAIKRIISILLLPLFFTISACLARQDVSGDQVNLTAEERAWLDAHPEKLTLYFNVEFPPIEFISETGVFIGMGADVLARVEELLGVTFIRVPSDDWNEHLAALYSGECAIAPTIVKTVEREKFVYFTRPYATVPVVIITTRDAEEGMFLDDFAGRSIGVVSGYATENYLHDQALFGRFEVMPVANVAEGLQSVSFRRIDAFAENLAVAAYFIDKLGIPNLRVSGTTDYSFAWSIGVSREYPLLYSAIQKALDAIPQSELDSIRKQWIALEADPGLDPATLRRIKVVALFLGLLLVSLAGITIVLKRRLNQKVLGLRESEERFRLSMEAVNDGVWDWDIQTGHVYYSPGYVRMLGYETTDVPSHVESWIELIHPEDKENTLRVNMDCIENRTESFAIEFRMQARDGSWKWILGRGRAVGRDASGKAIRLIGTHQDITERKHTEDALRQSEVRAHAQRFAIASLTLDKGVLEGDLPTSLERITKTVATAMDTARASVWTLSEDHSELCCLSLFEAGKNQHSSGMVLKTATFPRYFKALLQDSRIFANNAQTDPRTSELSEGYLVPLSITSMLDAGIILEGRLTGVVCLEHIGTPRQWHSDEEAFVSTIAALVAQIMANDRRKQAEAEKEKLQAQLNQAQKMESVGILAGGVAHDFNNLLHIIRGNVDLLADNVNLEPVSATRVQSIIKSLDRAAQLVQQLLLFSRKAEFKRVRVDVNQEVEEVVWILERTIPRMIDLELHLDPNVWPVSGDPVQIEQILLNLTNNAVDAMPDGGRLVVETSNVNLDENFVRLHPGSTTGPHVLLSVTDTGCGMDREVLEHVFDPFFTTKEPNKGTGLGLPSVYGIVKAHGGYIQCYSEPGQGSTFRVYLPATENGELEREKPLPEDSPYGGNETILVVDDEQEIRELTREALEVLGYSVKMAANGEQALDIYREHGTLIDLVLLDLNMPGMGGYRCLQELLQLNASAKVVIASGYTANGHGKDTLTSGAKAFLDKPFQLRILAAIVRGVLDDKYTGTRPD